MCFDGCSNIGEVLERLQHIRTKRHFLKVGVSVVFIIVSTVLCISRDLWSFVSFALSLSHLGSCFFNHVMDSLSSSASTVPSIDDYFEHNVWNPALEMLFLEQVCGINASCLVEVDLAQIAISCHFALYLFQGRGAYFCTVIHWAPPFGFCGTIATFASSCLFDDWRAPVSVSLFSADFCAEKFLPTKKADN